MIKFTLRLKTIVPLVFMLAIFARPAFAIDFACQPETKNAVSYSAYTNLSPFVSNSFVKYTTSDTDEYWFRLTNGQYEDVLLDSVDLVIDGIEHPLTAIEPTYKHLTAAVLTDRRFTHGPFGPTPKNATVMRYFALTPEVAKRLKMAKEIRLKFSTFKKINQEVKFKDAYIDTIKKICALSYADAPDHWKPAGEGPNPLQGYDRSDSVN